MPETFDSLEIAGYDKMPIKNTLTSTGKSNKIAIVFPGIGYTCQMPVLYHSTNLLLQNGYDVLWVEYDYRKAAFRSASDKEKISWLNFDAKASYDAALKRKYTEVLLLGKSLGSFALLHLVNSAKASKCIWLTPLIGRPGTVNADLYESIKKACKGCLFIIGTKDPLYNRGRTEELRKLGATVIEIGNADHSLEVEGDVYASIAALRTTLDAIKASLPSS